MRCPVCNNREHVDIDLHSEGFAEDIIECGVCGAVWSVNHGVTEIVNNPRKKSTVKEKAKCCG